MNHSSILALIGDLYEQLARARADLEQLATENEQLRAALGETTGGAT